MAPKRKYPGTTAQRKRVWSVKQPSSQAGSYRQRQEARKQRKEYKLKRIEGFTKDDLERRRDIYDCMKGHLGRYYRYCNPRTEDGIEDGREDYSDEADTEGDSDEEGTESYSDEEAELSESWSDGTESSAGGRSATYSELLYEREEVAEVTKYIKDKIAVVDTVATNLQVTINKLQLAAVPVGDLQGEWTLYNLDICPKTFELTGEYYRLWVSPSATKGKLLDQRKPPQKEFEAFIDWMIKDTGGDIKPFLLPQHASLERIPILLIGCGEDDVPVDITFLGDNCLRLRVPRSIIFPAESRHVVGYELMIEFAGIRRTEADKAARKARLEDYERQRRARCSGTPSVGAQFGGYAESDIP
jgi:hypothetical protein